jgi:tetratricopeptide (TPR) repeat protein
MTCNEICDAKCSAMFGSVFFRAITLICMLFRGTGNFMFRASAVMAFVFGACFVLQGQQAKPSIAAIETLIRSHEYDQALQQTKSALRETPNDVRLWTLEGIVYAIQGSNQNALAAFDKALHFSPDNPAALRGEVQILYPSGDRRAIPLLEKILKNDPKDETAQEMLGTLERKQGDCQAAVDHFRLSGDAMETHPDALGAYGDCLVRTNHLQDAIPVFERLSALVPQQTWPKYDLAVVLVGVKQNDEAIKVLDPMIAADASDPDVLSLASEAYEATGNTPKAVALLRQAIVLNPSNPNSYVAFASLCFTHSSFQVGIDMIDAGLQRIHNDPSLYLSRGLLYAQLAQYDKAEADFNTVEQLDSAQSLSAYAIDLAEMQRNEGDKALLKIRAQIKEHPDSPWLRYALGRLLDSEGPGADAKASTEAIQSVQLALKLKPDFPEARNLLASLYMRTGQYGPAIEQCRIVLKEDPSDESATYHLIIALRRSGENGQKDEVPSLVKRLAELQQTSLHNETERNRYKLVEQQAAPAK